MKTRLNGPHLFAIAWCVLAVTHGCSTQVKITSSPAGALVQEATLGELGTTPLHIEVEPGKHSFVFSLPGHWQERVNRDIRGPEVFVHAQLQMRENYMEVTTFPGDATVKVTWNGLEVDLGHKVRPHRAITLDDERIWPDSNTAILRVDVSADGYEPYSEEVQLQRYEPTTLSYSLKGLRAELNITSNPPGADVHDRSLGYLGRTPFSTYLNSDQLARISARRDQQSRDSAQLQLICTRAGYATAERVVWVNVGELANDISFTLESE